MNTYRVLKSFRIVDGSHHQPGDKVRYGEKIGTVLVARGLAEEVKEAPKAAKPKRAAKKSG